MIKRLYTLGLFGFALSFCSAESVINPDTIRHESYIDLMRTYPQTLGKPGRACDGEIELVLDIPSIQSIEEKQYKRLLEQGHPEEVARKAARTGIIEQGLFWSWVRDPIRTAKGEGVYGRIILSRTMESTDEFSSPGAAILPILEDGSIILNLSFRHATRSWEIEIPAGMRDYGESSEDAARRELFEETGYIAGDLLYLGETATNIAVANDVVPVYCAFVKERGIATPEYSEAIAKTLALSPKQIEDAFKDGILMVPVGERIIHAHMRQSLLAFALYQAHIRGLLP